jgi:hypothetical protein
LRSRLPAFVEHRADYEAEPTLSLAVGEGRSFARWFSDQLVDQVDVVDVFLINS